MVVFTDTFSPAFAVRTSYRALPDDEGQRLSCRPRTGSRPDLPMAEWAYVTLPKIRLTR